MRIERGVGRVEATGTDGDNVIVETDGWADPTGEAPAVADALATVATGPDDPDHTVTGRTRGIELGQCIATVIRLDEDRRERVVTDGTVGIEPGPVLVRCEATLYVFCRFDGPATVEQDSTAGRVRIRFDDPTLVSVAFSDPGRTPDPAFTVEPSLQGIAEALARIGGTAKTTNPNRSWPSQRPRPPVVTFGDRAVPSDAPDSPETSVTVELPTRPASLVTAAPFVYYAGADVTFTDRHGLRLDGDRVAPPDDTSFERWIRGLTVRTFFLDCVVRTAGPHVSDPQCSWVIDASGIDADRLFDASLAERIRTYRSVSFEAVREAFPDWHLTATVAPTVEYAQCLPRLVRQVPLVWATSERSGGPTQSAGRARPPVPDTVGGDSSHGSGETHGRLAPGRPATGFDAVPAAYRPRPSETTHSPVSVVAVFNDGASRTEHRRAAATYERRATAANLDPAVRTETTVAELARLFESETSFVHFVGHRDERGIACADGFLDTTTLDTVGVEAFFLNACDSDADGKRLVRKGARAGCVTVRPVLDEEAARVGVTFSHLLLEGFTVYRGLSVASRTALSADSYRTVGDGTHVIARELNKPGVVFEITREGADTFRVVAETGRPQHAGALVGGSFVDRSYLSGKRVEFRSDLAGVIEELETTRTPVVLDGELVWPAEARARLTE